MSTVHLSRYGAELLVARFEYSPAINELIKTVPGREFNKPNRVWTFPLNPDNVLALREKLTAAGHRLAYGPDVAADLNGRWHAQKTAAQIRDKGDSDIAFDYLTTPYAHQRAGLAFLHQLGSGALFWEMGLGKTKTAIDYAEHEAKSGVMAPFRVLVITPNTVVRNWAAEIEKHAGHMDYVLLAGIPIPKRVGLLGTARYSIVNCEAMSLRAFAEAAKAITWDLVIVDESTRFKSPKVARTKNLHKLKAIRRVILTGTPITGKPADAWAQLEFVSPGTFGKSYWAFEDHYLMKDWFGHVTGIKPDRKADLVDRIDKHSFRILKSEVLDLPPKVYVDRRVKMEGDQAKAYAQMRDELRVELENAPKLTAWNVLTVLLRLTQITAGLVGERTDYLWLGDKSAKVRELDDLLNDELAGEQVVVFGVYQRELEELAARYATDGREPPILYGPTPEGLRHQLIQEFQEGSRRLLFAQIRTGGIGINLTAAKNAIYHTRDWSLESYLQSQDRLHRIGQTGTVSIIHLLAEGSIDEDIAEALSDKQGLADDLTGDRARRLAAKVLEKR